jgi:hypothetical protein
MQASWRNVRLIHLPIHASWLNQIELFFSIVQRKALTPNDFGSLAELATRLRAFGEHYRSVARPLQWTFTRADLDALLARLADHQPPLRLVASRPQSTRQAMSAGGPQMATGDLLAGRRSRQ